MRLKYHTEYVAFTDASVFFQFDSILMRLSIFHWYCCCFGVELDLFSRHCYGHLRSSWHRAIVARLAGRDTAQLLAYASHGHTTPNSASRAATPDFASTRTAWQIASRHAANAKHGFQRLTVSRFNVSRDCQERHSGMPRIHAGPAEVPHLVIATNNLQPPEHFRSKVCDARHLHQDRVPPIRDRCQSRHLEKHKIDQADAVDSLCPRFG